MAALGCVSQLVLNLQFVLLQSPPPAFPKNNRKNENKETNRGGGVSGEAGKTKRPKELKAKPTSRRAYLKTFVFQLCYSSFSIFFLFSIFIVLRVFPPTDGCSSFKTLFPFFFILLLMRNF